MERRSFVKLGLMSGAAGVLGTGLLQPSVARAAEKTTEPAANLAASLAHCLQVGNACVAHCMSELAKGNKELADCNRTIHDMLAACEALLKLDSYKSELAKPMAKICMQSCDACADACKKHSAHWAHGMHLICKECYEACLECSKLCKAV